MFKKESDLDAYVLNSQPRDIYECLLFWHVIIVSLIEKKQCMLEKKIFKKKNTFKPKRDSAESDLDAYVLMYL